MSRSRAQSGVWDGGIAQCQVNIREGCAITARADGTCWQAKQKIGKGKKEQRSVRSIGAYVELIAEYLRSKAKIVPTSRQRCRIGEIEIVICCRTSVSYYVPQLESALYLNMRQASHLQVA